MPSCASNHACRSHGQGEREDTGQQLRCTGEIRRRNSRCRTTPEMLRLMLDVNLEPALWLSQAVTPHMRQQGSGAIVHVAARPGIDPTGGMAAYSVSKAALIHLTRVLDVELRPNRIRVNAVAAQLIDTPGD